MFKVFFGFKGRIGRLNYLLVGVVSLLIWIIVLVSIFDLSELTDASGTLIAEANAILYETARLNWIWLGLTAIIVSWMNLAAVVKRLHDLNRSGWWLIVYIIGMCVPILNAVVAIVAQSIFSFIPGRPRPNQFGEDQLSLFDSMKSSGVDVDYLQTEETKKLEPTAEEMREERIAARMEARRNRAGNGAGAGQGFGRRTV